MAIEDTGKEVIWWYICEYGSFCIYRWGGGLVWVCLVLNYKCNGNKAPVETWALYFHVNAAGSRESKASSSSEWTYN